MDSRVYRTGGGGLRKVAKLYRRRTGADVGRKIRLAREVEKLSSGYIGIDLRRSITEGGVFFVLHLPQPLARGSQ